jgi:hypothetical protein
VVLPVEVVVVLGNARRAKKKRGVFPLC